MPDIIFDMPLDEATNSPIAYDYSQFGNNGDVFGATFIPGHDGYAAHFDGNSYIRAGNPIQDLSQDFTLVFWLRTTVPSPYDQPQSLLFQFAFSDNSIVDFQTPGIVIGVWQSIVVVKSSAGAKIYIDGLLKSTLAFSSGNPVEWAIKQGGGDTGFTYTLPLTFGGNNATYALGDIDGVLIYNAALSDQQIAAALNPSRRVFYRIDGTPFENFDVYVKASSGVIDGLELKEPVKVDWAGEHGEIVDLKRPRYKPREIELDCFIYGGNYLTYATKFDAFIKLFQRSGLHRLKIEIDSRKPLLYEVYLPNATDNDKKWRTPDTSGNFKLKLVDPQPIRRVLRFNKTLVDDAFNFTAKIRFSCNDAVNIYWGDGTVDNDVIAGADLLITHTYSDTSKKYWEILITGEPDNISNFSHNCILVWNRL